jgi:hypothetical protein
MTLGTLDQRITTELARSPRRRPDPRSISRGSAVEARSNWSAASSRSLMAASSLAFSSPDDERRLSRRALADFANVD